MTGRLFSFWRHKPSSTTVAKAATPEQKSQSLHLLTEYVLHMSITSLAEEDITPLYEEYIHDDRLGTSEKDELTQAYLTLQLRSMQSSAAADAA